MTTAPAPGLHDERVRFQPQHERMRDKVLATDAACNFLGLRIDAFSARAVEHELPKTGVGYAYHDLVALALDRDLSRSMPVLGLRMMMRFADQSAEELCRVARWSFQLRLTEPDTDPHAAIVLRDPAEAELSLVGGFHEHDGWVLDPEVSLVYEGVLRTSGANSTILNRAAARLYDQILNDFHTDRIRFQWISPIGRDEFLHTWSSGRADCVVIARVATPQLQDAGLSVRTRWGRVLGPIDARHTWVEFLDDDGAWKRFDPLLELHCHRLWGAEGGRGSFFRGGVPNALPAWPGTSSMVVKHTARGPKDLSHEFVARMEQQ